MCSIFAILSHDRLPDDARKVAVRQSNLMSHRGPDASGIVEYPRSILVHNRISVVDVFSGGQPLRSPTDRSAVVANAEIYNHERIRERTAGFSYATSSDCEAILGLLEVLGPDAINQLEGMFAFAYVNDEKREYCVARDHIGILSLYYGYDASGRLYVSSELKSLERVCDWFAVFPPGHYLTHATPEPVQYYDPDWRKQEDAEHFAHVEGINDALTASVRAHLMSDVPVGLLLSGGLDSSLIASIAVKESKKLGLGKLKSYSVGLDGSPDLEAARDVAEFLGTSHFEYIFDPEEGIDALESTIYHLESYDVTSVRASVPMYLIARRIRGDGTKVVLTGDGADEVFGGYLYFHYAPSALELHKECVDKLGMMHLYDCMRANKTMLSWGVEPRVPFLDKAFLDYAMTVDPRLKLPSKDKMEKFILRNAFRGYLPDQVLWRQKEQSSDGVGYSWIGSLRSYAEASVSDRQLTDAAHRYKLNTPRSKEALLYRNIFSSLFSSTSAAECAPSAKFGGNATNRSHKWLGSKFSSDPSGRSISSIHSSFS
ncbi:asparagine synthase B [Yoonia maritima]|uniref:asparagine synthase B n=1 Tax=Yoonia maritima TaxID=1435347 RepID=UPI000D0EA946|nr:asparagine synthase B [Yoonia maritima]